MKKTHPRKPIYHDDEKARKHLEKLRWPHGPACPHCGVTGDRITKLQGKSTRPGVYKCKDCRKPFTVTVGTVMERSHIPLSKWIRAAQLMTSSKKNMSAHRLHRMIGTNYETAWFLFHRLQEAGNDLGGADPLKEEDKIEARPLARDSEAVLRSAVALAAEILSQSYDPAQVEAILRRGLKKRGVLGKHHSIESFLVKLRGPKQLVRAFRRGRATREPE